MADIKRLLVANRGEIAIRVFRAATELKMQTVAIFTAEDRFALHRFKADQSFQIGAGGNPIGAYLDIDAIIELAKRTGADAIHPGYGFLSENPEFADACRDAGIIFVGPPSDVMRQLGNKVAARKLAESADVPVMPASEPLPTDLGQVHEIANSIGYPLMLKASWGGGGRGMRMLETPDDLDAQYEAARREAGNAFGNDEVYFEKLVRRARHIEVQVLGDQHGNLVHLFERDCSVQRRHQKVVERAPAPFLPDAQRDELCAAALRLVTAANYVNAGTVEFLQDVDTGEFYFIEVNPRIQVEHTVTEEVTGVDIVKAQLRVARGERIGDTSACPHKATSLCAATPCSAGSRPRIRQTTSCRTTGASRPIAARAASGFDSTAAPPMPARASRLSTTPCSSRSRPGRKRRTRQSTGWIARCASFACAASIPTSHSSRT